MAREVLRPQPSHSAPLIVLSALGLLAGLGLALGFALSANPFAAAVMALAALMAGASCLAYFRNASIWFDDKEVGKVNLLGIETKCRLDQLGRVESMFSPQPTLNFFRKDGSRAFRINTRLWTDAQVQTLKDAVGQNQ